MIDWYVATGESMDKAGAYGYQGKAAAFVQSLQGCYYNILGFPLTRFMKVLHEFYPKSTALWNKYCV
jgi:septum formation protein